MRRAIAAVGALVLGAGVLAAAPIAAAEPLRLTVGTLGPIGSLDPRTGRSQVAHEVWNLQYPTLTALDPKTLDPVPGLAQAWAPAPNGRGWVYTLRPGAKWSDGKPVTAADVVASVYAADIGVPRALSEREVEIDGPATPDALVNITPSHVLGKVQDLDKDVRALGVGAGAWHVTARTDDSVQLDATRPSGPAVQQIVFRAYPNADALVDALARGDVDVVSGLPNAAAQRLGAEDDVTVDHAPDGTQFVMYDRVADARVRQAISLAIDRTDLVAKVADGIGTPGVAPILARGAAWGLDDATTQRLTAALDAQPERARELLATGAAPKRTLRVSAPDDPTSRRVAEYVVQALARVGLQAEIVDQASNDDDLTIARNDTTASHPPLAPRGAYSAQLARARAQVERDAAEARLVGLFQPDTLQAFRSDNVAGFLRSPQVPSLVVFAPTTTQYSQLIKAPPPPGEQASATTYAVGAIAVVALGGAVLAVAAWIRRRSVA